MFSFDNLIRFIVIFSKYKPNVEYQQSSIEEVTYCNMFVFARYAVWVKFPRDVDTLKFLE